ncbi:phage tail protein [Lutimaribacter sp. EGI FJ00015]|uniref:Phage tail protein n=1 Tax=Lutimaribacter degradans TaxID=2945989 RepID=A0ACC6A1A6_9RHOB|nr:phage tail protein [Lutimaribacter sp. EGI FJ00013]MCM2563781.1 phage tail protein [Lutimaribacter sp. EGI FJ00013]MCO0614968.1 phage tail protein [Lutimaribacter sp. EGI FJ00015]MCO0637640.1 phage tail protein [Lutimaribacter sp. EGI FJ00014]
MAVLAVAGLGAWGSAALGLGWQAGWLLGSVVGQSLFGPKLPDQQGPRLSDLAVSSSAYGAPIPIAYGTLRIAGNMIWSTGLIETTTTTRVGGKGGGGGQKVTEYSYAASFALAFGEGPADQVLRLWADGKLIFDRTGAIEGSQTVARDGLRMRFYPGDETQLPDPLIASVEGAGSVPAHRGLCYIVFEDFELADYGNRIPNITAEITWRAQPRYPVQRLQFISGPLTTFTRDELAVDWRRGRAFLVATSPAGLRRFTLRNMHEDRQVLATDVITTADGTIGSGFDCLFCGTDGAVYCTLGFGNARPILRIDPDALRETGRFGSYSIALSNGTTRFTYTRRMAMITRGSARYLLTANGTGPRHLGLLNAGKMAYHWHENSIGQNIAALTGGAEGEGWALTGNSSLGQLHRIRVTDDGATRSVGLAFTPSDIDPEATSLNSDYGGLNFDPADGGLVFWCGVDGPGFSDRQYIVKWRPGLGILWRTAVAIWPSHFANRQPVTTARLTGTEFAIARDIGAGGKWRVIKLDLRTGAITLDADGWLNGASGLGGAQVYDGETDSLLAYDPGGRFSRLWLGRAGGDGATLGGILSDLCARGGLAPSDIDVSEMTDTVPGFVLGRQGTLRGAIEPLARAYFFDGVESDDRLAFRKRGRPPAATLSPDLLIPLDGPSSGGSSAGEIWRETRSQEVDLPERVSVLYMDASADYQQGSQSEKRATHPVPTMGSRHQVSVELPMALTPSTARTIAARALYAAWSERCLYEARLPSDYLRLEPTDVVTITLPSGGAIRARLERVDLGADLTLALRAVAQEAGVHDITRQADGGQGRVPVPLGGAPETRLHLPDLPLLRDVDAPVAAVSRAYIFMGGYGSGAWPGAALFRSSDSTSWEFVARNAAQVAHGVTQSALGAPPAVFATDEINSLRVAMTTGGDRLASVSQSAMLDGSNPALLIRADGAPEVLQFREVTPLGGGSYELRGFLRGRRGTDIFVSGHTVGETFLLLEPGAITSTLLSLGDLGLMRYWRAVGLGESLDRTPIEARVHRGRDLMPYAPVHPRAVKVGSDIQITWTRRTRLGGDLRDGTGTVPLSETVEAYEVDILASPGGAVLRTLTTSTPSVTYPAAAIAADFTSPPATLAVRICQMSGSIGRGVPRLATLTLA